MSELSDERRLQRLKFIDLSLLVLGYINRPLLNQRFNIKDAVSTKDLTEYQEMTDNLAYSHKLKAYHPSSTFQALYIHDFADALKLISEGKQEVVCTTRFTDSYIFKMQTSQPNLVKVSPVLRALLHNQIVEIEYVSRSSGVTKRQIIPHSIIQTGVFSYIRAFDRLSGEFRTFKLNRIKHSVFCKDDILIHELKESDSDWNQDVELVIVPNGDCENAISYDYGIVDGEIRQRLKKPLILYYLMDYNIAPINQPNLPPLLFPLRVQSITELSSENQNE